MLYIKLNVVYSTLYATLMGRRTLYLKFYITSFSEFVFTFPKLFYNLLVNTIGT